MTERPILKVAPDKIEEFLKRDPVNAAKKRENRKERIKLAENKK